MKNDTKILMVCLGNICRSPLAEGILKSKLPENFTVASAGTIDMHEGKRPDSRSVQTANQYNVDISAQKSRHFHPDDFNRFDRIYCMDKSNLADVLSLTSNAEERSKVSLIIKDGEVPDPYWGDLKDFDRVFNLLDQACKRIAEELQNSQKV